MDLEFKGIVIDALTEALARSTAVTIKNASNNCIIVITAIEGKIILSLSKMPQLLDDLVHTITDALGAGPDLIYDRVSLIKDNFIIYYAIWIRDNEESRSFVEKEFALGQNHITYLSPKAISLIKDANLE